MPKYLNNREFFSLAILLIVASIFLFGLKGFFFPLCLAWIAAYICQPVINYLESKNIARPLAVILFVTAIVVIFGGALSLLIPWLIVEVQSLVKDLPNFIDKLNTLVRPFHEWIVKNVPFLEERLVGMDNNENGWGLFNNLQNFLSKGLSFGIHVIAFPVFFVYLLYDFYRFNRALYSLVPKGVHQYLNPWIDKADEVLAGYFRGMLIVSIFLAFAYGIGFSIAGIRYGFIFGFIGGLFSFIPYAGSFFAAGAATLSILVYGGGWGQWLGLGITFAVAQPIESYILTPNIVGRRVGLSAFATLVVIIIGGNLGNIFGVFVAVPIAALLYAILYQISHPDQS